MLKIYHSIDVGILKRLYVMVAGRQGLRQLGFGIHLELKKI